jgi:YHS domain-containing protein
MFRFLFELIGLLLVFLAIKSLISWVMRLVVSTMQMNAAATPSQNARQDGSLQSAGELYKDPVCGTFVPPSSLQSTASGKTVYFCSQECRDRYLVSSYS